MDFLLGLALFASTLLGPDADVACTKYHTWEALMVEGKQVSGQNLVSMSQLWTQVSVTGKICGPGKRNTIIEMCGWASGADAVYFDPWKQMVRGQFTNMIPVEVGVNVECMPDTLNGMFLPMLSQ
jgi:hypothetical protein